MTTSHGIPRDAQQLSPLSCPKTAETIRQIAISLLQSSDEREESHERGVALSLVHPYGDPQNWDLHRPPRRGPIGGNGQIPYAKDFLSAFCDRRGLVIQLIAQVACWRVLRSLVLKILVSVVRFRPGPPRAKFSVSLVNAKTAVLIGDCGFFVSAIVQHGLWATALLGQHQEGVAPRLPPHTGHFATYSRPRTNVCSLSNVHRPCGDSLFAP